MVVAWLPTSIKAKHGIITIVQLIKSCVGFTDGQNDVYPFSLFILFHTEQNSF